MISDRCASRERLPVPGLLAAAAVHHALIQEGLRTRTGLVLDVGDAVGVHQICALIGFGADAVHPWLAFETLTQLVERGAVRAADAHRHYKGALDQGLLKVMSKMGIATLDNGYKGAQIFEAVGLGRSPGGEVLHRHDGAPAGDRACRFGDPVTQGASRCVQRRDHRGPAIAAGRRFSLAPGRRTARLVSLQHREAAGGLRAGRFTAEVYLGLRRSRRGAGEHRRRVSGSSCRFNHCRIIFSATTPVEPEVDPEVVGIRRTSICSLQRQARMQRRVAMNRIGAMSGTGEGGEQVERFGTERSCSMKQVASGRFGVTLGYLNEARQIEIKMAQGVEARRGRRAARQQS